MDLENPQKRTKEVSKTTSSEVQPCVGKPVTSWPEDGLEQLGKCPVCGSVDRQLLHEELTDRVFFSAPGEWNLWHCCGCTCAYLDPRPTEETIHLAYQCYYTHGKNSDSVIPTGSGYIKEAMMNDHLCTRLGVRRKPRLPLGRFLLYALSPAYMHAAGRYVRHLPAPSEKSVCLDVGCGDGSFFEIAKSCGWHADGLEPDPIAAQVAREKGMAVYMGRLPNTGFKGAIYDYATMNHVVEHLHNPVLALQEIKRILKPGGSVWIATPNTDSAASRRFGMNWRGLEPPRHLVLFNSASLTEMLALAGFKDVAALPVGAGPYGIFSQSYQIAESRDPYRQSETKMPWQLCLAALFAAWRSWADPALAEELILTARKPVN